MAVDIDYNTLYQISQNTIEENLRQYSALDGSKAFTVVVKNKEWTDKVAQLVEAQKKALDSANKQTETIDDSIEAVLANTDALQDNTEEQKKQKDVQRDATVWRKRIVDGLAKVSGFITGRIDAENKLYKSISESNITYTSSVNDINKYANSLGMSIDEYTKYLQNNSQEFNSLQTQLGSVLNSQQIEWRKLSESTGATREEIQKGVSAYTKMIIANGQITQMTEKEYTQGLNNFITDIKTLGKAVGQNTESILKQIESNEKQWNLQYLMANPATRNSAMAMQAAGFSTDQIVYTMTGKMSEEVARQMALNDTTKIQLQTMRNAAQMGQFSTTDDIKAVAESLKNNQAYQSALAMDEARKQDMSFTSLTGFDEQYTKGLDFFAGERAVKFENFANIGKDNKELKDIIGSITEKETSQNVMDNNAFAMTQMGENIIKVNDTATAINNTMANLYAKIDEKIGPDISAIAGYLGVGGTVLDKLMPVIKFTSGLIDAFKMLKDFTSFFSKTKMGGGIGKGLSSIGKSLKTFVGKNTNSLTNFLSKANWGKVGTVGAKAGSAYLLGANVAHLAEKYGSKAGTGIAYGFHRMGIGIKDLFGGYNSEEEHQKAVLNAQRRKDYYMKQANNTVASKYLPGSTLADKYIIGSTIDYNTPTDNKLKETKTENTSSETVNNNKNEVVEKSVKTVEKEENPMLDSLTQISNKLSDLVNLFDDVKDNTRTMSSKMAFNNYS